MKKKIIKIMFTLITCATVSLSYTPVKAASIDDTFTVSSPINNNQELTYKIIAEGQVQLGVGGTSNAYKDFEGALTIPETVEYDGAVYEVVKIADNAFLGDGNSKITSVIGNSITSVEYDAFRGNTALTSVSLPNATVMSDGIFYQCPQLASINLPNVTKLGMYVFSENVQLTSVSLPMARSVGGGSFYGCTNLANINLPNAIVIGFSTFEGCTQLTNVVLGATSGVSYKYTDFINYPATIYLTDATISDLSFDGKSYKNDFGGTITPYDISITENPASVVQKHSTATTLSVNASITSNIPWNTLSYQWEKETNGTWNALSGQTDRILTIASLSEQDAGMYRCKINSVANPTLVRTSNTATITLNVDGMAPQSEGSPKTGDATNVGYLILGAIISGSMLIGFLKKKQLTK